GVRQPVGDEVEVQRVELVVVVVVVVGAGEDLPRSRRGAGELPRPHLVEPQLGGQARQPQKRRQRDGGGEEEARRLGGERARRGTVHDATVPRRRCGSTRTAFRPAVRQKNRENPGGNLTEAPAQPRFLSRVVRRMPARTRTRQSSPSLQRNRQHVTASSSSTRANPSRGGDAKPWTHRRRARLGGPPGCRKGENWHTNDTEH